MLASTAGSGGGMPAMTAGLRTGRAGVAGGMVMAGLRTGMVGVMMLVMSGVGTGCGGRAWRLW